MKQIIMTDDAFVDIVLTLEEYARDCNARTKAKYIKELEAVHIPPITKAIMWARLMETKVFKDVIGDWQKVEGNCVYIND